MPPTVSSEPAACPRCRSLATGNFSTLVGAWAARTPSGTRPMRTNAIVCVHQVAAVATAGKTTAHAPLTHARAVAVAPRAAIFARVHAPRTTRRSCRRDRRPRRRRPRHRPRRRRPRRRRRRCRSRRATPAASTCTRTATRTARTSGTCPPIRLWLPTRALARTDMATSMASRAPRASPSCATTGRAIRHHLRRSWRTGQRAARTACAMTARTRAPTRCSGRAASTTR